MGTSGLVPKIKDGDWVSVRQAIAKLSTKLGPVSEPTYAGLTLTGLTASRLIWGDANKALASKDLIDLVAGTANEVDVADDGSGGVTIGIVNPLIVSKGGTGLTDITDHRVLIGSGTGLPTLLSMNSGQVLIGSTGADPVPAALTGTANQVIVTGSAGSITLSTPQDINTTANVTFNSVGTNQVSSLIYYASVGLVGIPTYTFTGRITTGLWSSAVDTLNVSCGGAEILELDASEATFTVPVSASSGSAFGNLTLADGSITDSGGVINFGNENLSTSGDITLTAGTLYVPGSIVHYGDADTYISFLDNQYFFAAGGAEFMRFVESLKAQDRINVNLDLADIDFIVAGANEANLLVVDAATDTVRMGDWDTNYTQFSATGDITQVGTGRTLESAKYKLTAIGGVAIKLTNTTGAVTVAGQLVKPDIATDDAVILTAADELEIIGVFLDSGVADDAEAWVVISGIADVAMEDNTLAAHGNWVRSSITEAGYADATNAAAPQPINQTHFAEVGHCIESVAAGGAGTHILARCVLHFN